MAFFDGKSGFLLKFKAFMGDINLVILLKIRQQFEQCIEQAFFERFEKDLFCHNAVW